MIFAEDKTKLISAIIDDYDAGYDPNYCTAESLICLKDVIKTIADYQPQEECSNAGQN